MLLLAKERKKCAKRLLLACFGQCEKLEIALCSGIIFCPYKNLNLCLSFCFGHRPS